MILSSPCLAPSSVKLSLPLTFVHYHPLNQQQLRFPIRIPSHVFARKEKAEQRLILRAAKTGRIDYKGIQYTK